jgi:hypothetical protein
MLLWAIIVYYSNHPTKHSHAATAFAVVFFMRVRAIAFNMPLERSQLRAEKRTACGHSVAVQTRSQTPRKRRSSKEHKQCPPPMRAPDRCDEATEHNSIQHRYDGERRSIQVSYASTAIRLQSQRHPQRLGLSLQLLNDDIRFQHGFLLISFPQESSEIRQSSRMLHLLLPQRCILRAFIR